MKEKPSWYKQLPQTLCLNIALIKDQAVNSWDLWRWGMMAVPHMQKCKILQMDVGAQSNPALYFIADHSQRFTFMTMLLYAGSFHPSGCIKLNLS